MKLIATLPSRNGPTACLSCRRPLHTPLMSGANAISGITIVGALYTAKTADPTISNLLGGAAILFATINVIGGFMVTDRMLKMFGKKK
jgi:NAD(P) transhydrogenase subunit alpha